MREILFKAKRIDNNEWVEGYVVKSCDKEGQMFIVKSIGIGFFTGGIDAVVVNPDTICEFTQLTDKNGKRIFEGDIVKVEKGIEAEIGVIKFNKNYSAFRCETDEGLKGKSITMYNGIFELLYEVIGNIHDNKELL